MERSSVQRSVPIPLVSSASFDTDPLTENSTAAASVIVYPRAALRSRWVAPGTGSGASTIAAEHTAGDRYRLA